MKKQLLLFLRTLNARAYVRIFGQMREATWVVASILGGFFTMTTYIYLYRTLGTGSEFSGLVVLGGFMTPFFHERSVGCCDAVVLGEGNGEPGADACESRPAVCFPRRSVRRRRHAYDAPFSGGAVFWHRCVQGAVHGSAPAPGLARLLL